MNPEVFKIYRPVSNLGFISMGGGSSVKSYKTPFGYASLI